MEEKFGEVTVIRHGDREIRISTADRADSTPYALRYAETLVFEGDRIIDMDSALEGGQAGHLRMVRKWLEELFGGDGRKI